MRSEYRRTKINKPFSLFTFHRVCHMASFKFLFRSFFVESSLSLKSVSEEWAIDLIIKLEKLPQWKGHKWRAWRGCPIFALISIQHYVDSRGFLSCHVSWTDPRELEVYHPNCFPWSILFCCLGLLLWSIYLESSCFCPFSQKVIRAYL